MKISEINYEPLERLKGAFGTAFKQVFKGRRGAGIAIASFLASVGALFISVNISVNIISVIIGGLLVWVSIKANALKKQNWRDFATVNGWQYMPPDMNLLPPGLQKTGHSQAMSEIINAKFETISSQFFKYQYTVGSGKHSHEYYFTIVRVDLGEQFPHIILDSNNSARDLNKYHGYQNLKLEGDFNKYFSLYLAPGKHIDVLSIITPDVMQTLIDSNNKQDIEIYNNSLYFVQDNDHRTPDAFKKLLLSVQALSAEMAHRAKSLNYQPNQTQKQV